MSPTAKRLVVGGLAVATAVALPALTGSRARPASPHAPAALPTAVEVDHEGDDAFLQARQAPGQTITAHDLSAAVQQANRLKQSREAPLANPWTLVGPTNIGGRITDIGPDPTLAGRVFVGTATGGLWKSTDGGVSLTQSWPDTYPQAIGAVTVAPNGTVYVGTGEVNPGGGSLSYGGDGLYRSIDQGATWQLIGLQGSGTIGAIRVDPTNLNRIFVAVGGSLFVAGGVRGVYRTTDGGTTWQQVLAPVNGFTGAADLIMDPTNPNRLFASMWEHHREWLCRCYAGPGSGIYRSIDGGNNWTRLSNVLVMTPGDTIGMASDPLQARMGVAIAPSNPLRVYVTVGSWSQTSTADRAFRGFYRSDDGGDTFVTMGTASPGGDTVWTSKIWVDPVNQDTVYIAGVSLVSSTNGGLTWGSVSSLHADHHAMAWDPTTPNRVYQGNDGGFYRSTANGANGSWVKATNQPFTQFYTVDVGEQDPTRLVGGTQDNGCIRSWNSSGVVTGSWTSYGCGDGLYTLIDYADQNRVYGCSQFGSCNRSTNAGNSNSGFGATTSARRNWQTPVVFDPNNPAIIYYGGNQLNRSTNNAAAFTAISPSLSNPASGTDPAYPFGTLTTVSVAKTAPSTIYAGTDDAWLWGTADLGANWTRFTDPDLPDRWVTRVAADPTNANTVYATYSGYRNADNTAHVLRSIDGGTNWTDISGNLPGAPTQDVVVHPSGSPIYVASDVGVFVASAGSTQWAALGTGLPLAPVNDIRYHAPTNTLYAATYGRGVWKISGSPTAVVVRAFGAVRARDSVMLRWRTASELQLLGFHVYRQIAGKRVRLNRELIPAGSDGRGRSYAFRDRLPGGTRGASYWLEEVRAGGTRVKHGPVKPA
jgi:sortilin (neurotensin receptor 3)